MPNISARIKATYKSNFAEFARRLVVKQQRVLERSGAYTQKVMRNSMPNQKAKRSRKSLKPGRPPRGHVGGHGGLRFVLFDVSMATESVVIGPGRTAAKTEWATKEYYFKIESPKIAPRLLNERGPARLTFLYYKSRRQYVYNVVYQQYPISAYPPTLNAAITKFRDFLRTTKL